MTIASMTKPGAETLPSALRPPRRSGAPRENWSVLPARERDTALALWRRLEHRWVESQRAANLRTPTPVPLMASSFWMRLWLDHYGADIPHEFVVLDGPAGPGGIALLTRGRGRKIGPFPIVTRHLGTAGERPGESVCVEYNRLLVLPEFRQTFAEQLVTHVLHDKSWESLCMDGFEEAELAGIQQDLPGFELRRRPSPYYDLRATRERGCDLLDPLGRSTRQNVRRLLRKYGELELQWAEQPSEAEDILGELIELHQARWKAVGQPGAFHSRRFRAFQESLVAAAFERPAAERPVVLFRVRHAGATVGCLLLLNDGGRLLDYLSGFADFEEQPSPGIVTHVQCLGEALRRGFDAYDFLVGEKRHKDNLSTNVNTLVWAVWSRRTVKGRVIDMVRNVYHCWKELRG